MRGGRFGTLFNRKTRMGFEDDRSDVRPKRGEISVEIFVGPKGIAEDLDIEIAGGRNEPYIPGNPGLFIVRVRPGSDASEHLFPGNQITKIDGVDVTNVPGYVAQNLFRSGDGRIKMHVITTHSGEVSHTSSKAVSWGTISLDTLQENSDSGRGTDVSEKEGKISVAGEKVNVKIAVGHYGELLPLDFEIYGGQDEPSIEGNPGIFLKELKIGSPMEKKVKVGDQIVKVNGCDVTNVPRHMFFNILRGAENVAKIQIMKTHQSSKGDTKIQVFEDENTSKNEIIVEISTGPKGRLGQLGFRINGGRDRPCVPGDPGIFIKDVKSGSVVDKIIGPGDKILKIDGSNVTNVQFRFAMDRIKAADRRVRLHIKKADPELTEHDNSKNTRRKTAWRAARSFSTEQLQEFQTAFSVYDRTMKGRISLKHVLQLCRSLGHNLASHDIDLITTEFRLTGDSKISFMDFIQMINKITASQRSESCMYHAFEVFDREEKGFFSVQELEQAFKEMPGSEDIPEYEVAEILDMADPDRDGHIKYDEFRQLVLPLFHQY